MEAIAYKYADPTEGARLVYDQSDFDEIAAEDPSLLLRVGDRIAAGNGEDYDTGRVIRIDSVDMAFVGWDSQIQTPAVISDLRPIDNSSL